MKDPAHPIWYALRLSILMVTMLIVLKIFASKFDWTEVRTLLIMFFIAGGLEVHAWTVAKKASRMAIIQAANALQGKGEEKS